LKKIENESRSNRREVTGNAKKPALEDIIYLFATLSEECGWL